MNNGTIFVSNDIRMSSKRVLNNSDLNVHTLIDPVLFIQTKHCGTPIDAIAKIGGLLFVLRVSFFIRFLHELLFEWKMRRQYPRKAIAIQSSQGAINDTAMDDDRSLMLEAEHQAKERDNNYFKELFSFENFKQLMDRVTALEQEKSAKYEEFSQVRATLAGQFVAQQE